MTFKKIFEEEDIFKIKSEHLKNYINLLLSHCFWGQHVLQSDAVSVAAVRQEDVCGCCTVNEPCPLCTTAMTAISCLSAKFLIIWMNSISTAQDLSWWLYFLACELQSWHQLLISCSSGSFWLSWAGGVPSAAAAQPGVAAFQMRSSWVTWSWPGGRGWREA